MQFVFNRNTRKLIGFTDLGDPDLNFATLDNCGDLATHALVFMASGICTKLKYCMSYFATVNVTSECYKLPTVFFVLGSSLYIRIKMQLMGCCCNC